MSKEVVKKARFYQVQNLDGNGQAIYSGVFPAYSEQDAKQKYSAAHCKTEADHIGFHEVHPVKQPDDVEYHVPSIDKIYSSDVARSSNSEWECECILEAVAFLERVCANSSVADTDMDF
ncbi:hypothetical protein LNQ82_07095 [Conchiformibius steedae DSM 2580]|uniref:Uncharacterized protein n=1 Tax=Conchiformibius steedae DSM 2580 TaxID=1121352 RepID=A0AAE9KZK8_9NEIS|nr:hypothetical protein [Conchiformibius steedae]QMT34195.1 hypothetical protein H3L98_04180 [Conchiformibius steedae]URD66970.1 hypothetical protein LNQ82_07095 [Conchiformibius steedae DSM 2580]